MADLVPKTDADDFILLSATNDKHLGVIDPLAKQIAVAAQEWRLLRGLSSCFSAIQGWL